MEEKCEVVGGAGVSGALLNGIGDILKVGFSFINDIISTVATTVFLFQHPNDYDKLDVKIGDNSVKYDRSIQAKSAAANQDFAAKSFF
ncbi:hypothetical protein SCLARK_001580 [Spiroplasma clarkii]|uniref:Uncharacterized protein n=1 Tax=Spiroplasma clarkii TaxID=2139 RepID=A0A1Y0L2T6_9MOLU|nr:hypothetical protein [Spiroplasma clarkii]ARU92080.1 hypothetical protein SCLARK_001580 [Spiroplasma clarkii]ATX71408.1 hypothetical protein SCLAR_v1c11080 [Spiroplasma clarkii]